MMMRLIARKLNFNKKQWLGFSRTTAIIFLLIFGLLLTRQSHSQTTGASSDPLPAFEVVSITPDDPDGMSTMVSMMFQSDGYSASHCTLKMLIKDAYGLDNSQISGAPKWIGAERYGIEARIDNDTAAELNKLDENQRKLIQKRMLQALLATRFGLVTHYEVKELSVYSLAIAKNGPKLQEAKPGNDYVNGLKTASGATVGPHMMLMRLGGGQIGGQDVSLDLLVKQLSSQLGGIVLDNTGLTGKYDFNLKWTPDTARSSMIEPMVSEQQPMDDNLSDSFHSSLFTAIQEQLGLKLEPQKSPVKILVIDHVERPSAN